MPKLKTNKAMRKRFRITKKGKVIGSRSLKRHMLADRHPGKKRQSRRPLNISSGDQGGIRKGLPYDR